MLGWLKTRRAPEQPRSTAPVLPLDLSDPAFVADPYPTYEWLRENCPVVELTGGGYLLTRHADIRAAFTNPALGNAPSRFSTLAARNAGKYVAADLAAHIPPFLDGDDHKPVRQMVSRSFFNAFKGLSGELDVLAREHVAKLNAGDDLIRVGSQLFSLASMMRFCGVEAEPEQMKRLTQAFFHLFAPLKDPAVFTEVNNALSEFRAVLASALEAGPPKGSLLAELRDFQSKNADITDAQIVDNCLLVFADGVENIEAGAASLMLVFEQADLWGALERGDMDMELAVREGLRLQTPAQLVPRVARTSFEIGGVAIKKDMPVFLALASGNRDESVFAKSGAFDPGRDPAFVLTFGQGRHRCIGEPLAIAQLVAFMGAIVAARLRPQHMDISYQPRVGHRWPDRMLLKKV
ncbi:MAG: cytochrome P450 [Planktotalea sp.]|uniref:cytochrome P450 n=1 Tax=Planktotalea sp. TaxID=2029877 RepID=UPI003C76C4E6